MKYFILQILLLFAFEVFSQCGISRVYTINDEFNEQADTTNVSILVSGATINNLADPNQGVCGVKLKFRHNFMKELFIELISPSGQKITLTGGDINAYFTGLITWDVTFVPMGATAIPDPGFSAVWENDQDWLSLNTYTGFYYPHIGNLENFNMGPVNGTWTLRCIDFADGDEGILLDASLIFCDDEGVTCGECILDAGIILNPDISYCEGDDRLAFDIAKFYPTQLPIDSLYEYSHVIFKDSTIYSYSDTVDLRSYPAGKYTICGLQYAESQVSALPAIGSELDEFQLKNLFFSSGYCADVSDSCMVVIISNQSTPTNLLQYICAGTAFTIDGTSYDQQGIYDISIENGACDSLIRLDLRLITLNATIESVKDSLSCLSNFLALTGTNEGTVVNNLMFNWFTNDGQFDSPTTDFIVDIIKEGTYFLEVSGTFQGITCRDTTEITIYLDSSNAQLFFRTDTLTCRDTPVEIELTSNRPILSKIWTSEDGHQFVVTPSGISVTEPGKYTVRVTSDNGCVTIDTVTIYEDVFFENPLFTADTLTCREDSIQVFLNHNSTRQYNYTWTGVIPSNINARNPIVVNTGLISVVLEDNKNGCGGSFTFEVEEDKITPIITSLTVDTISCDSIFVIPSITTDKAIENFVWSGPQFSSLPKPMISNPGNYNVVVTSVDNGCTSMASFTVEADTLIPIVTLMVDSLSCINDTVTIQVSSNIDLKSAIWSSTDFSSMEIEPEVSIQGNYTMNYTGINGCVGQTEIFVPNGEDVPKVIYAMDSIKCGLDTLQIKQTFTGGSYEYEWEGIGLLESNIGEPRVIRGGVYKVTITNTETGCTDEQDIEVVDDRIYTVPQIISQPLDCLRDSVQIRLLNNDIVSIEYTFENGFYSDVQSPFVTKVGTYYYTFVNQKNCITSDSVLIYRNDIIPLLGVETPVIKCQMDSVLISGISSLSGTTFHWRGNGYAASGKDVFVYQGGNYVMIGIAPNNCKDSISFTIGYDTLAPVFNILPPDTLTCKLKEITLRTDYNQPLSTLRWQPSNISNSTLQVTAAGQYIAQLTSVNNCISYDTVNVIEQKIFPIFEVMSTVINCKDLLSNVSIIPSNEYSNITWRNMTNPEPIPQDALTFMASLPGTYVFDVVNNDGCVSEGSVVVTEDRMEPNILSIIIDTINCFNPIAVLKVNVDRNVLAYIWMGPNIDTTIKNGNLTVTKEGDYQLSIVGDNFCTKDTIVNVIKSDDVPEFTLFSDTLTCTKGKITIGVDPITPIFSYRWENLSGFMSDARNPIIFEPGTYFVSVTGSNGCISVGELNIIQNITLPIFEIADTIILPCDTSLVTLSVMTNDQIKGYKWIYPSGTTINIATPESNELGDYTIQVTGVNGCIAIDRFHVDVDTRPPGFDVETDTITCRNQVATLSASSTEADVSYEWKSESGVIFDTPIVNTTEPGKYILVVSNANRCRDTLVLVLPIDTLNPTIDLSVIGDIQCESRDVTLDASASSQGDEFVATWSTDDGTIVTRVSDYIINVLDEGSYQIEILNLENGCVSKRTEILLEQAPKFTDILIDIESPSCEDIFNGSIILTSLNGTPPYHIVFNGTDVGNLQSFFNLASGVYQITVTDGFGCVVEQDVVLTEGPDLKLSIEPEITINFGDSILLAPEFMLDPSGQTSLVWENRDSILCVGCPELWVRPFVNTIYTITYGTGGSCEQTVSVLVKVVNDIEKAIPNIFRPNSSGGNNIFYIPQVRGIKRINEVIIYDRWAENVFNSNEMIAGEPSIGWDGTFKGKEVATGVYVLFVELELEDGQIWKYRGDITLIR